MESSFSKKFLFDSFCAPPWPKVPIFSGLSSRISQLRHLSAIICFFSCHTTLGPCYTHLPRCCYLHFLHLVILVLQHILCRSFHLHAMLRSAPFRSTRIVIACQYAFRPPIRIVGPVRTSHNSIRHLFTTSVNLTNAPSMFAALPPEPPIPASSTQKDLTWLLVLTSALVSCHHGPGTVVQLYKLALSESTIPNSNDNDEKKASQHIQRQIQEVLVKGSVIFVIPPSLDTIFPLLTHIRSSSPTYLLTQFDFSRSSSLSQPISSLTAPAHEALRRVYQNNLDEILDGKMGENMQDLKFLTLEINYGFNLANQSVIGWRETELVVLAALVGQNCRAEVLWHMRGGS